MERSRGGPRLILFSADGAKPEKVFPLAEGETRIGRDPENEICVKESTVSRFHCRLVRRGGTVQVFDVKCRNPTRIGKVEADGRTLRAGEVLSVGKLKLKFRDGKPPAKRPAKSPPRPPRLSRKHRDRKSWQRSSQSPVVFAAVLTAAAVVAGGWWLMRSPPEPTQVSDREGGPAPQRGAAMPSASPASGRFAPVPSTGTKSGDLARASGAGIRLGEKRVEGTGAADAADSVDVDVDSVDVDVDVIDVADREADENLAPASNLRSRIRSTIRPKRRRNPKSRASRDL